VLDQLKRSKDRIESEVGQRVVYLAAPGGRVSNDVIEAAGSAGYQGVFTSEPGYQYERRVDGLLVFRRFILKRDLLPRFPGIVRGNRLVEYEARASYSMKQALRSLLGRR
jgi:peptidoglycan/xylan/chitin deacetylase (PgdA/CDA1 family)